MDRFITNYNEVTQSEVEGCVRDEIRTNDRICDKLGQYL